MSRPLTSLATLAGVLLLAASVGVAGYYFGRTQGSTPAAEAKTAEGHDDHDHAHGDESPSLVLSDQARENLGLKTAEVEPRDYWRTVSIPGVVSESAGHSERRISSSIAGIVSDVHVVPGQSVRPGEVLMHVQITDDLLATTQSALLKTVQEQDLVDAELKRIEPLSEAGTVPGTRLLEKQYEKQRLQIQRTVQTQELLVRGLTQAQVEQIVKTRELIREYTVRVPPIYRHEHADDQQNHSSPAERIAASIQPVSHTQDPEETHVEDDGIYTIESINVYPGKVIQPGETLVDLALHTMLQITGLAFQRESELLAQVIEQQRPVTAVFETGRENLSRENLKVLYADNTVDPLSKLFRFYIELKNEISRDVPGADGVTFRSWRFKPGQRVQLLIPVEHWENRFVVPIDAVVHEGAETAVFRVNGKKLERVVVAVTYEDTRNAVLADDGSLFPGDEIAMNEAYQLQLALKKKQSGGGGGGHSHAGHDHAGHDHAGHEH